MAPAPQRGGCLGGGARFCHANGKSGVHPPKPPCGGGARGGHVAAELPAVRTIAGRCVTPIRAQAGTGAVRHASSPRGGRRRDFLRVVSAGPNSPTQPALAVELYHLCRAALKSRTSSVRCKFRVLRDRKTIC